MGDLAPRTAASIARFLDLANLTTHAVPATLDRLGCGYAVGIFTMLALGWSATFP